MENQLMKTKLTWMLAAILCCGALFFTSCSDDDSSSGSSDDVEEQLQNMTLREKVGQLFYVRPETLAPSIEWDSYDDLQVDPLQEVTEEMKSVNEKYPVGGVILYAWNINDRRGSCPVYGNRLLLLPPACLQKCRPCL